LPKGFHQFWDGFNKELYDKYLELKKEYREKLSEAWRVKMN